MADEFGELVARMGAPSGVDERLRDRQIAREKAQRDAATGVRARAILRGDLGPILRRWVSASILPVSGRLRTLCEAVLRGDFPTAASVAESPVFGLPDLTQSPDLLAVLKWALKADHLDDLVLAVMGEVISGCAKEGKAIPLTRMLTTCGDSARETAMGQFLTQVQGAKAMLKVRRKGKAAWKQTSSMDAIAALMTGQVRDGLLAKEEAGELPVRGKSVVTILTQKGEERMITLRPPEDDDWDLLNVARQVKGERDGHVATWCSFAMLVLCCAQAEAGWFDLVKITKASSLGQRRHRGAHGIVLSDAAHEAIKRDLDKWLRLGFVKEPLICEPELGDYLSVKHKQVAGGRGPMGARTNPKGTDAWRIASDAMSGTAWTVPPGTLAALRDSEQVQAFAVAAEPDELRRASILGAYRRMAREEFFIPIVMDFRGRVYTGTNLVTYQGRDLQKSLMCFPEVSRYSGVGRADPVVRSSVIRATVLHAAGLYGGPDKLDKASWEQRWDWWQSISLARAAAIKGDWTDPHLQDLLAGADEPLQLLTALTLQRPGQQDRLACQIDGTCNGLQHLSALFRDDTAAHWVNLTASSMSDAPQDIYGEVGRRVAIKLAEKADAGEPWAVRLVAAIVIDRKLCKKPVMVLPYGGTKSTIEDAVFEAILDQAPEGEAWRTGLLTGAVMAADWEGGKYAAFAERDLKDHPLLHLDARRLGALVWESIVEILPKPIAAMNAFREIARAVGERSLEWSTGVGVDPLWVVQAKAQSTATSLHLKGLHLPNSVRGLKIRPGRDEVDAKAHVSGIVANFIHSQDAAHQTRTMAAFQGQGRKPFGAIFDCYISRPSLMGKLGEDTREAFRVHYEADPLDQEVILRDVKAGSHVSYPSWYALAEAVGVSFPERGRWDPSEVRHSAWFFS